MVDIFQSYAHSAFSGVNSEFIFKTFYRNLKSVE